jgi:PHP family Zn ribbon phosphoesterase
MSAALPSIEEIVSLYVAEGEQRNVLIDALTTREQDRVDHLMVVASRHNVVAPVMAKVMLDLELGRPKTDEEKAFLNKQFEDFVTNIKQQYHEATGIPLDMMQLPPTGIVEDEVEDTPEEGS